MVDEAKIETLWEITHGDLYAEAFKTQKGTFLTIMRGKGFVTLTADDIEMLLKTVEEWQRNDK